MSVPFAVVQVSDLAGSSVSALSEQGFTVLSTTTAIEQQNVPWAPPPLPGLVASPPSTPVTFQVSLSPPTGRRRLQEQWSAVMIFDLRTAIAALLGLPIPRVLAVATVYGGSSSEVDVRVVPWDASDAAVLESQVNLAGFMASLQAQLVAQGTPLPALYLSQIATTVTTSLWYQNYPTSTWMIAIWSGKVNMHRVGDSWRSDPDGISGIEEASTPALRLTYCRKWYGSSVSAATGVDSPLEEIGLSNQNYFPMCAVGGPTNSPCGFCNAGNTDCGLRETLQENGWEGYPGYAFR